MTFYASFWDAINGLPKKDQLPLFRAVVSYGLCGNHKETLSASQKAFFALMQPVLDSSRKKAANGKQGGSKTKANGKQTATEKENEIEIELENEIENEIENECYISGDGDDDAREATADELSLIGLIPGLYSGITLALVRQYRAETERLVRKHMGREYVATDCRYVVQRTLSNSNFGSGSHIDRNRLELLDYAMGVAAASGHGCGWDYVHGIMERLAFREITSVQQAMCYDMMRPDKEEEYDT